jgi:DNA mismatch repair protein MutS2
VDQHSLELLEFPRLREAVARGASSDAGRARLRSWRPIADPLVRAEEVSRLAEAIRRSREPGAWCAAGRGVLSGWLEPGPGIVLDGPALLEIASWLDAGVETLAAWDEAARQRFPALSERVRTIVVPERLHRALLAALDPDGGLKDSASPRLGRLRKEHAESVRSLEQKLERWARGFGEQAYVTRHGDRFVALVPAAGFPRRRAIVHDRSGTGQSLFVEPIEMCEANNRLAEMRAEVLEEERRILRELAAQVTASAPELERLGDALVHLDTLRARALWALAHDGIALAPEGERMRLRRARHPLLALQSRSGGAEVVPLDLDLGTPDGEGEARGRVLLVSGPNMGGKTVLLKTVGLLTVCAQAAFPVTAAEGSAMPEVDEVLVDLGDEQSIEQGLSTFAAHLKVLARMAESAGPRTLVLADELGAGTDPEEGAALAQALIEHLAAARAWVVVTTHLGSLKRMSAELEGVVNGSLEFDVATLSPCYRFLPGVPGASHALSVAERLGFPERLLRRARHLTPDAALALERLTAELTAATRRAAAEAEAHGMARREAEEAIREQREAREATLREAAELRRRLSRESEALLARSRELWQTVQREARRSDKSRTGAERLRAEIAELEGATAALAGPEPSPTVTEPPPTLAPGTRVHVADLGVDAEIVSAPDAEGRVQLRRGSWNIQSHVSKLGRAMAAPPDSAGVRAAWEVPEDAPSLEVDLRGMDVTEALATLDGGLDRAIVAGLAEVRVIHGVGRGVLRAAVEKHLRGHPQVTDQRMGGHGEGGRGVTVARLR